MLQLQLCFGGVHAQCKLCNSRRFHRAVLRRCLRAHCCALTGAGDGPDSAENREVSALFLGQGCLARCCKTGVCPDSAENREVSACVLGLGSMPVVVQRQVPDGRDSAENCGVSAVGHVTGLSRFRSCSSTTGVSAHHGYDELMRRLFRAVYTGTRPGLTPAIRAGKGWRGRQELAQAFCHAN